MTEERGLRSQKKKEKTEIRGKFFPSLAYKYLGKARWIKRFITLKKSYLYNYEQSPQAGNVLGLLIVYEFVIMLKLRY